MLLPPVFWPGEFHGLCSPWSLHELDMTEQLALMVIKLDKFDNWKKKIKFKRKESKFLWIRSRLKFYFIEYIHFKFIFHLNPTPQGIIFAPQKPGHGSEKQFSTFFILFPKLSSTLEMTKEKIIAKMRWNSTL